MESRLSASLGLRRLPSPNSDRHHSHISDDFHNLFTHFTPPAATTTSRIPFFASTTTATKYRRPRPQSLMKSLSVLERALIGAGGGGIAGAFTYFCLHPLDTIKTKLQTKGASAVYANAFDAVLQTFQTKGLLGFYSGISAVVVGSTAVYFGTCEFGKSFLSKSPNYPPLLIPPTAGAMGNIVSSAIMVPKELITQRMQAGAITTPLDVVKTRLMTQNVNKVVAQSSGVSETVRQIIREEGWVGFTRGMGPRVLHSACFSALGYFAFETARLAILNEYIRRKELQDIGDAPA